MSAPYTPNTHKVTKYQLNTHQTALHTAQIKELRAQVIRSIDFLEKNKYHIDQNDYKNLFSIYLNPF